MSTPSSGIGSTLGASEESGEPTGFDTHKSKHLKETQTHVFVQETEMPKKDWDASNTAQPNKNQQKLYKRTMGINSARYSPRIIMQKGHVVALSIQGQVQNLRALAL